MTAQTEIIDFTQSFPLSVPPSAVAERVQKHPECRLLWAVLEQGIETYMKKAFATSRRSQRLYQEAEAWIWQDDPTWLCSFVNICHILGLDPDYLRTGLKRWRAAQEPPAFKLAA